MTKHINHRSIIKAKEPAGRTKNLKDDPEALKARERVKSMIDAIPPEDLVASIKKAPSLRGMILGYVAELMFEKHIPSAYELILSEHIESHDDHDRNANKADRTIAYNGRKYGIQLKSMQTNSITRSIRTGLLQADVQNDASDKRRVVFEDGTGVETTCYLRDDYDILAVPLFPFTGQWNFAYKRNIDCRSSVSAKYTDYQREFLLSTTEKITWHLSNDWTMNLLDLLTDDIGTLITEPTFIKEPDGHVATATPRGAKARS